MSEPFEVVRHPTARRIRLSLDAVNLSDEREAQYNSFNNGFGETGAHRLWNHTTSGRTVFIGANMQF